MPQLDSDPVRILLVDDESLMRAGLKLLLDGAENLQVVGEAADGAVATWVRELEFGRFGLPVPDLQVYLDVPTSLAAERARSREAADAARERDAYERDGDLQAAVTLLSNPEAYRTATAK